MSKKASIPATHKGARKLAVRPTAPKKGSSASAKVRTEDERQLLALLRTRAHKKGTFVLASGKTSDFFIDCKRVLLLAEGHRLTGKILLGRARRWKGGLGADRENSNHSMKKAASKGPSAIAGVAGVELGGCPLASSVSFASASTSAPLNALYVRKAAKDHGSRQEIEGADAIRKGAPILLLEDVVTTGGSSLRAVEQLRKAGFSVAGVLAIVDRLEGGAAAFEAAGVPFEALFSRHDF